MKPAGKGGTTEETALGKVDNGYNGDCKRFERELTISMLSSLQQERHSADRTASERGVKEDG